MSYSGSNGYGSSSSLSYSQSNGRYSALEKTVASYNVNSDYSNTSYMATDVSSQIQIYENNNFGFNSYDKSYKTKQQKNITTTPIHIVDDFLNPRRPLTSFVGNAKDIQEFAEETFEKTTGIEFPDDIIVKVLAAKHFREGLQGFAINRKEEGLVSEVVIKEDTIDRVMVILGHELGHVMSKRLNDARDEEAKAFAFSMEWIKQIKKHNIAGLSTCVCNDKAAKNGIHDKALEFVLNMVQRGKKPLEVFKGLVTGELRCAR